MESNQIIKQLLYDRYLKLVHLHERFADSEIYIFLVQRL
ncbi:hypothetical protein J2Z66_001775 [Paenibacillus eucommiae]|uniref:Uncharacterized protein n=1 Tax=Paenibacillus eucommiae TaxID=1355755 RepID=A0ABS4IRI3_9BACL|nr:hypothetical protein [Paenibacillus eucommiae]